VSLIWILTTPMEPEAPTMKLVKDETVENISR